MTSHKSNQDASPAIGGYGALTPHGVAALGAPREMKERMIGLQSAIYRVFVALGRLRSLRLGRASRVPTGLRRTFEV